VYDFCESDACDLSYGNFIGQSRAGQERAKWRSGYLVIRCDLVLGWGFEGKASCLLACLLYWSFLFSFLGRLARLFALAGAL
jgi:hypothetical protein